MALAVGGRHDAVRRAYDWLRSTQRDDGSWPSYVVGDRITDPTVDANFCAYIAAGLWHHTLLTADVELLAEHWEVMERAVDYVLTQQRPGGEITWAVDVHGAPYRHALLTSTAAIHLSLRCAVLAADALGESRPHWREGAERVAHSVRHREHVFELKDRWAMDWYYPVLGGAVGGDVARRRLAERWDDFVIEGRGVRCVSDRPWVTAAETCELVMALDAIGLHERARTLFTWVHFLRHDDGSYWTGMNFEGDRFDVWGEYFTAEQPTWNSAAVVLAANALGGTGPTAGLFRGEGLPGGLTADELIEAGAAIEADRGARDRH